MRRIVPPTFHAVALEYMNSARWERLSPRTKTMYESSLKNLIEFWGDDITKITRPMLVKFQDRHRAKPGMVREACKVMNNIMAYAYDYGYVEHNVAAHLRNTPSKPIARWSQNEFQRFVTSAPDHLRRAAMLALYTGQRRSDITKMEWDHIIGDCIEVTQKKTKKTLLIPIHKDLRPVIDGKRKNNKYIIWNNYGAKWSNDSLTKAVRRHAISIGMKDRCIHGLRKSTASILAERGATPSQIAAITGQSLGVVEHYCKEADQKSMATAAMEVWK
jgi:integrase